jgi:hypothetical protein
VGAFIVEATRIIMKVASKENSQAAPAVISVGQFCSQVGISPITAWRWRRSGWLQTINIAGRQYLTAEAVAEFKRRAVSGEFSREHAVPNLAKLTPA